MLCMCDMESNVWPIGQYQITLAAALNNHNNSGKMVKNIQYRACLQLPASTYIPYIVVAPFSAVISTLASVAWLLCMLWEGVRLQEKKFY